MTVSVHLPAGQKLTVTSTAPTTGSVFQMVDGTPGTPYAVTSGGVLGLGPFTDARTYCVLSVNGVLAVSVGVSTDKPLPMFPTTIPENRTEVIPANHLAVAFGTLTVAGRLTVNGTLRVAALPALT